MISSVISSRCQTSFSCSTSILMSTVISVITEVSYIKGCHICQLSRKDKSPTRQLQTRINLSYRLLSSLSMELKVMLKSHKGHKFILCIISEVTNYHTTAPIYHSRSEEKGNTLIENVISKYCIPELLCEDSASFKCNLLYLSSLYGTWVFRHLVAHLLVL